MAARRQTAPAKKDSGTVMVRIPRALYEALDEIGDLIEQDTNMMSPAVGRPSKALLVRLALLRGIDAIRGSYHQKAAKKKK